jgi:hypothetical protein
MNHDDEIDELELEEDARLSDEPDEPGGRGGRRVQPPVLGHPRGITAEPAPGGRTRRGYANVRGARFL